MDNTTSQCKWSTQCADLQVHTFVLSGGVNFPLLQFAVAGSTNSKIAVIDDVEHFA